VASTLCGDDWLGWASFHLPCKEDRGVRNVVSEVAHAVGRVAPKVENVHRKSLAEIATTTSANNMAGASNKQTRQRNSVEIVQPITYVCSAATWSFKWHPIPA